MNPYHFRIPMRWLGMWLVASLLVVGCTRGDHDAAGESPISPAAETPTFDPADRSQYRYLYAVYCNGTVDRLDLVQREKVGSFQLSERTGDPPAVAAVPRPYPGMRTMVCLSRPVVTGDMQDQAEGIVDIVASDKEDPDGRGYADFSLLTFSLPDWTLRHVQALGSFHRSEPPRLVRVIDGYLMLQPRRVDNPDGTTKLEPPGSDPWFEMVTRIKTYTGGEDLNWNRSSLSISVFEWSADNILFRYPMPPDHSGTSIPGGFGIALANRSRRQIIGLEEFPETEFPFPPDTLLAPGGQFVLILINREGAKRIEYTGELRLYDAGGRLVSTVMEPDIAGETRVHEPKPFDGSDELKPGETHIIFSANIWYPIALTPDGLAVFTDRRGDYRFVDLGQRFGVEPVVNPSTSDYDGTRPGIVYARQ